MQYLNENRWNEYVKANSDPYGGECVAYAKRWAELMEKEIDSGAKLKDIASETSHTADTEGITGFMYGAAVSMLFESWKYGESLRQWHNAKYSKAPVTGVINPAVLTIN